MSKSLKFKNNSYLDSAGIVHNRTILKDILDENNDIKRNICAVFDFGKLPKMTTVSEINQNVFGIYTIVNDDNAPHNSQSNDWFTVVNIPANQGTNYSVQIAFSYWDLVSSSYGVWIKHGRTNEWNQVSIS